MLELRGRLNTYHYTLICHEDIPFSKIIASFEVNCHSKHSGTVFSMRSEVVVSIVLEYFGYIVGVYICFPCLPSGL